MTLAQIPANAMSAGESLRIPRWFSAPARFRPGSKTRASKTAPRESEIRGEIGNQSQRSEDRHGEWSGLEQCDMDGEAQARVDESIDRIRALHLPLDLNHNARFIYIYV